MHLDWPSVFSIFSAPKISRVVSGSDTRNIRLAGNRFKHLRRTPDYGFNARSGSAVIFSMQDLRTQALASTSASIVNAGLTKVWPTELKVSSHGCPFEPGFRVPSVPLQKVVNEKHSEHGIIHTPSLEPITAQSAAAPIPTTHLPCPKASQSDSELPTPKPSTSVDLHLLKPVERISHPKIAPILTHLPLPRTGHPEPYTPADPQHPSGSRFLSFSLQRAANKKPDSEQSIVQPPSLEASRTFSSVPQPATAPLFAHLSRKVHKSEFNFNDISPRKNTVLLGLSAANGSESTQPDFGLNLFTTGQSPFYLHPVSSPQITLFNFPSTFPPAQSLLFLPPSPPPKRKFIFNPFSPEEDTVPLPPAPEITYSVRSPDHKFPVNTSSPPLFPTDHTVPYSPLSPMQNSDTLSPLSIALLLSPCPAALPPPELIIKIAGPEGYLNADHYKPHVTHFLLSRATELANSLVIVWQLSHVDSGGARGLTSLKALFAQLDEKVLDSDRTALSSFSKLSITIPDLVKDVAPYNDLLKPVKEDDSIDLANAVDLLEFTWHGDFVIFASKFKNLSFATLAVLNLKSSHICIEDAVTLLHSCPNIYRASLGTIQDEDDCEAVLPSKHSYLKQLALPKLSRLALESNVALHPLIRRILWTAEISLSLTLTNQATVKIHRLPIPWDLFSNIELNCHLTAQELFSVKKAFPAVKYNDIST